MRLIQGGKSAVTAAPKTSVGILSNLCKALNVPLTVVSIVFTPTNNTPDSDEEARLIEEWYRKEAQKELVNIIATENSSGGANKETKIHEVNNFLGDGEVVVQDAEQGFVTNTGRQVTSREYTTYLNRNNEGGSKDKSTKDSEQNLIFWTKTTILDRTVYQRNGLFDPNYVDSGGMSNIERMQEGLAPIGYDGEKINLHHLTMNEPGPVAEVSRSFHEENKKALHFVEDNKSFRKPDGRKKDWPRTNSNRLKKTEAEKNYEKFRGNYWKERSKDFLSEN